MQFIYSMNTLVQGSNRHKTQNIMETPPMYPSVSLTVWPPVSAYLKFEDKML